MSEYERGHKTPSDPVLQRIADVLGVTPEQIRGDHVDN